MCLRRRSINRDLHTRSTVGVDGSSSPQFRGANREPATQTVVHIATFNVHDSAKIQECIAATCKLKLNADTWTLVLSYSLLSTELLTDTGAQRLRGEMYVDWELTSGNHEEIVREQQRCDTRVVEVVDENDIGE